MKKILKRETLANKLYNAKIDTKKEKCQRTKGEIILMPAAQKASIERWPIMCHNALHQKKKKKCSRKSFQGSEQDCRSDL